MYRKRVSLVALALALLFMSAACSSESPTGPEPPSGEPVAFRQIAPAQDNTNALPVQGAYGGYDFTEPKNIVLRSEDDFARFWRVLHSSMTSPPARPAVDFSENVVVAVMQGRQPTGGYSIAVKDVATANEGVLHVDVEKTSPGPACGVTQALTSPYQIVEINRPAQGQVDFSSTETVRACDS